MEGSKENKQTVHQLQGQQTQRGGVQGQVAAHTVMTHFTALMLVLAYTAGLMSDKEIGYPMFTYAFRHANIFHLACNLIAIYSIKDFRYLPSMAIGVICYMLPRYTEYTVGFSGVICAAIGIIWGEYFATGSTRRNRIKFVTCTVLPLCLSLFIPQIDGLIHIYALIIGLLYGYIRRRNRKTR